MNELSSLVFQLRYVICFTMLGLVGVWLAERKIVRSGIKLPFWPRRPNGAK